MTSGCQTLEETGKNSQEVLLLFAYHTFHDRYSENHTLLNPQSDKTFWDFSLDEFVKYDCPAVIHYIQEFTNSSKVVWIGHSQGTTMMFGLLSSQPEYSKIVEPYIALAPVAHVGYIDTPSQIMARQKWLIKLLSLRGGKFLPDEFLRYLAKKICQYQYASNLCANVLFFLGGGWDSPQLNYTRIPVYGGSESIGTSVKTMVHWAQNTAKKTFKHFDYGYEENIKRYGRPDPPDYPLEQIDARHVALFSSLNDGLADPRDVQILRNRLKGRGKYDKDIAEYQ